MLDAATWEDLYMCRPSPEELEKERLCWNLAVSYHEQCNAYDMRVCSYRDGLVALPVDGWEFSLINRNAKEVRKRIEAEANSYNLTWGDIKRFLHQAIDPETEFYGKKRNETRHSNRPANQDS